MFPKFAFDFDRSGATVLARADKLGDDSVLRGRGQLPERHAEVAVDGGSEPAVES